MELSENLKLNNMVPASDHQHDKVSGSLDTAGAHVDITDDAESQMRKALGLLGEGPRHRVDAERTEAPSRGGDRFSGGLHRRRFVQDGDVPVTVLRREQAHESPVHRAVAASVPPTTNRLQRTEAALAGETAAREKAERSLGETQMIVRDLQTKIGHAELARNEAIEALRREREGAAQDRAEAEAREARFLEAQARAQAAEEAAQAYQEQLQEERQARKALERTLRTTEAAREASEQLVLVLSKEVPERHKAPHNGEPAAKPMRPSAGTGDLERADAELADPAMRTTEAMQGGKLKAEPRGSLLEAEPEVIPTVARRGRAQVDAVAEPEPVKWWLNTKAGTKRR